MRLYRLPHRGQALTEYALIITVIALTILVIAGPVLANPIQSVFSTVTSSIDRVANPTPPDTGGGGPMPNPPGWYVGITRDGPVPTAVPPGAIAEGWGNLTCTTQNPAIYNCWPGNLGGSYRGANSIQIPAGWWLTYYAPTQLLAGTSAVSFVYRTDDSGWGDYNDDHSGGVTCAPCANVSFMGPTDIGTDINNGPGPVWFGAEAHNDTGGAGRLIVTIPYVLFAPAP
jgi:Flp pilus assembly pilin Flp